MSDLDPVDREIIRKVSAYCSKTAKQAEGTEERDLVIFAMQIVKKRMLSSRAALRNTIANRLQALKSREEAEPPPSRAELREVQSDLPLSELAQERIEERVLRAAVSRDVKRRAAEKRQLSAIQKLLGQVEQAPEPKFERLLRDIESDVLSSPDEKAIVFTEYRDTLEALKEALAGHAGLSSAYTELTGGLSTGQRQARIARFHEPDCRLLLATDAASEGLNLQRFCRRVYHVELPWNPNRMEQRNGRVDRHGQTRRPIIKYLFYPDSPEDRILDALTRKIATMQADRVSTPDLLGVCAECRIEEALTQINAEEEDNTLAQRLFDRLEEQKTMFVRDLGGMLSAGADYGTSLDPNSLSADPVMLDDESLESFMRQRLGEHLKPGVLPQTWSLKTPRELLGPRVLAEYPSVTFRRSVAIEQPARDVEFVHRLHPLFEAVVAEARTALTLPLGSNASAERLAARRWSGACYGPMACFTFLDESGGRPTMMVVSLSPDGKKLEADWGELRVMQSESPGEVPWHDVERIFGGAFEKLQQAAAEEAQRRQEARRERLATERSGTASVLREDAEQYRTDRLREIDEDEKAQRYGAQGELPLFREAPTGFASRRAGVETHFRKRMEEIADFEQLPPATPPQPLGALFVFPPES